MKNLINKLVLAVCLIAATITTSFGGEAYSVGLTAGYDNYYLVNGVARNNESALVAFNASKSFKYADVAVGGVLLPTGTSDQSHWLVDVGHTYKLSESFGLRFDASALRHQSGVAGIPNSSEFAGRLALENSFFTPYIRGSYDIDLQQSGGSVGIYRTFKLPYSFAITPLGEYTRYTDYEAYIGKVSLTRPIETPVGVLTPFVDVSYVKNNFFTQNVNFATTRLDGVVVSTGLNLAF